MCCLTVQCHFMKDNCHTATKENYKFTLGLLLYHTVTNYPPSPTSVSGHTSSLLTKQWWGQSQCLVHPPINPHTVLSWLDETLQSLEWRGERYHQYVTCLTYLSQRRIHEGSAQKNRGRTLWIHVISWVGGAGHEIWDLGWIERSSELDDATLRSKMSLCARSGRFHVVATGSEGCGNQKWRL